jgi:hypothetical protein
MAKSLPPVSAKLVADAEQFIAEFRRAERAAQGTSGKVANEMDKLSRSLSKKFSLGDIGKSVMGGLGIGSGFAIAQKGADMLVTQFEKAANAAEAMERATGATFAALDGQLRKRRTDEQELNKLLDDQKRLYSEIEQLKVPEKFTQTRIGREGERRTTTTTLPLADEKNVLIQQKTTELQTLAGAISEVQTSIADDKAKKAIVATTEAAKEAAAGAEWYLKSLKKEEEAIENANRILGEQDETVKKLGESYKDLLDPSREWLRKMDEVDRALAKGTISAAEHTDMLALLQSQMAETNSRNDFDWFEDAAEKAAKGAESAMLNFADSINAAFEESIIQGKELSDVIGDLGRSIMSTFVKLAVINPLMNSIFGGAKGWDVLPTFGGGKATGGPITAGKSYMVGENGPEMIVPTSSGTVIPNHELGSGGNTYYIDARGTDASVVSRLASALQHLAGPGVVEARALGAVMNHRMRGARA